MTEPLRFDAAPCTGVPALFFPELHAGTARDVRRAKAVCATCPYQRACLEYAIEHRENHGIWGGTTVRERRRIIRTRAQRHTNGHAA